MTGPGMTGRRRPIGQRGAALLMVIWMLALISLLAVGISGTAQTEGRLSHNLVAEARARYLAQAAVHHTVLQLLDPARPVDPVADGSVVRVFEHRGATLTVRLRDECGKLDINTGWGRMLPGLMIAHGEGEAAFAMSQAILDWRDPDDRRRKDGAEDNEYAADGLVYGARDGLFEAIDELQQVRGMTADLYRRLAPDLTVDCLNAGINALAASPYALASIPDLDRTVIERFLEARREAVRSGGASGIPTLSDGGKYVETSPTQVYEIIAEAELASGLRVAWQAVVWLTYDATQPFLFRVWRRAPVSDAP
jgi:general secretion pathway protein K